MRTFFYYLLAGAALHAQINNCGIPKIHFMPISRGIRCKNRKGTKAYADNSQKAKRNRPYYGHRNHKYIINHKNRK